MPTHPVQDLSENFFIKNNLVDGSFYKICDKSGSCYASNAAVGGLASDIQGVTLLAPCPLWKGVVDVNVVIYDELFQLIIIFISFADLIYQITKKK